MATNPKLANLRAIRPDQDAAKKNPSLPPLPMAPRAAAELFPEALPSSSRHVRPLTPPPLTPQPTEIRLDNIPYHTTDLHPVVILPERLQRPSQLTDFLHDPFKERDRFAPDSDPMRDAFRRIRHVVDKPGIVISITGSAENDFNAGRRGLERCAKMRAFFREVCLAAHDHNALIFTGGANGGVMKFIGEKVAEVRREIALRRVDLEDGGGVDWIGARFLAVGIFVGRMFQNEGGGYITPEPQTTATKQMKKGLDMSHDLYIDHPGGGGGVSWALKTL
jgi:hypothetical protein